MSHPPRRFWEDNYQARDVPDPEAGGGMSAEGQTILEALDELCSACAENPRVGRIPERIAALEARLAAAERRDCEKATDLVNAGLHARKLKGRLAEAERALREIDTLSAITPDVVRPIVRAALPSESGTPTTKGTQ